MLLLAGEGGSFQPVSQRRAVLEVLDTVLGLLERCAEPLLVYLC